MPDLEIVDEGDVQGIVLRGYGMSSVCHFTLKVKDKEKAREFIRTILPMITTSEQRTTPEKPTFALNIALTFDGLQTLEPDLAAIMEAGEDPRDKRYMTFKSFVEGPITRASEVGDVGRNAEWIDNADRWKFDVLLTLHAEGDDELAKQTKDLESKFRDGFTEVGAGDRLKGNMLPDGTFHFGFRDGIAQPAIAGLPPRNIEDGKQPDSPPGAFLLGYGSQWREYSYPPFSPKPETEDPHAKGIVIPESSEERADRLTMERFWKNGSFVAFRKLEQDVKAFEDFLTRESMKTGLNRELIAAKLCGRWRNGYPLVLAPTPNTTVTEEQLNNFDYSLDPYGHRCPFGAHIRRANPRDDGIASNVGSSHRIIRRGMPYGTPYTPGDNSKDRGLLGLFICVNLHDQFEFVMKNWLNLSGFNGNLAPNNKDPFVGIDGEHAAIEFCIPARNHDTKLEMSQFVTTRGAAYCFIPSITGLRYLAHLEPGKEYRPPDEDTVIEEVGRTMRTIREALVKTQSSRGIRRLVHYKSHGSVTGMFKVNSDLPVELQVGIFAQPGKEYDAAIRFSNADIVQFDDRAKDLRGMAIKIDIGGRPHDFNLVNHKVFFSRDLKDFLGLAKAIEAIFVRAAGVPERDRKPVESEEFELGIGPYLLPRMRQLMVFKQMQTDMTDPLIKSYYSQVPFQFGEGRAVKYAVIPASPAVQLPDMRQLSSVQQESPIRIALQAHLRQSAATFNFCVQLQKHPAAMPVEDALIEWDEGISPFVPIATLMIDRQNVTDEFEDWSFSPSNFVEPHRPLGGINRARMKIYPGMAGDRQAAAEKARAVAN